MTIYYICFGLLLGAAVIVLYLLYKGKNQGTAKVPKKVSEVNRTLESEEIPIEPIRTPTKNPVSTAKLPKSSIEVPKPFFPFRSIPESEDLLGAVKDEQKSEKFKSSRLGGLRGQLNEALKDL